MSGELQYSDQPADPRNYLPPPPIRPRLSVAQRRVVNNDDVSWVGWDDKNRPVVSAWYYAGLIQPQDPERRNKESELRTWAMTKNGDPTDITEPVTRI
jgi:hypothetical protein